MSQRPTAVSSHFLGTFLVVIVGDMAVPAWECSTGAWLVALTGCAALSIATARFPAELLVQTFDENEDVFLLLSLGVWLTLAGSTLAFYKLTGVPVAGELASVTIALVHGIYSTSLAAAVLYPNRDLLGALLSSPDVDWGGATPENSRVFMLCELAYFITDTILLLTVFRKYEINFLGHHVLCTTVHLVFLYLSQGRGGAMLMIYGIWAEISNSFQQWFWTLSHIQHYKYRENVGQFFRCLTTSSGTLYFIIFTSARSYCAYICFLQLKAYAYGALSDVFPVWGIVLISIVPLLILHGSFEMIFDMGGDVVRGKRHAFGTFGEPPELKEKGKSD